MAYMVERLEHDLSLLALEAAIEFEQILNKKSVEVRAINRLSEEIDSYTKPSAGVEPKLFSDPNAAVIMNQAILDSNLASNINNMKQLVAEASSISSKLISKEIPSTEYLKKMKDFCIALSKNAASYHMSIYELRPAHPNRY